MRRKPAGRLLCSRTNSAKPQQRQSDRSDVFTMSHAIHALYEPRCLRPIVKDNEYIIYSDLGGKAGFIGPEVMSAFDPKRTS